MRRSPSWEIAHYTTKVQRSAKRLVRGCEKFVPALAYLFCLPLPGSCLARFAYILADLCIRFTVDPPTHAHDQQVIESIYATRVPLFSRNAGLILSLFSLMSESGLPCSQPATATVLPSPSSSGSRSSSRSPSPTALLLPRSPSSSTPQLQRSPARESSLGSNSITLLYM